MFNIMVIEVELDPPSWASLACCYNTMHETDYRLFDYNLLSCECRSPLTAKISIWISRFSILSISVDRILPSIFISWCRLPIKFARSPVHPWRFAPLSGTTVHAIMHSSIFSRIVTAMGIMWAAASTAGWGGYRRAAHNSATQCYLPNLHLEWRTPERLY